MGLMFNISTGQLLLYYEPLSEHKIRELHEPFIGHGTDGRYYYIIEGIPDLLYHIRRKN